MVSFETGFLSFGIDVRHNRCRITRNILTTFSATLYFINFGADALEAAALLQIP